jgi:hypothetical protein
MRGIASYMRYYITFTYHFASVYQNYLFKGKPLPRPLLEETSDLIEITRLYCVRHGKYTQTGIYTQFFHNPLDSRFNIAWKRNILGLSQNDAGQYKHPFLFSVSSSPLASLDADNSSLKILADKLNTLKPSFHVCIGDLVGNNANFKVEVDIFRNSLLNFNPSTPIVR